MNNLLLKEIISLKAERELFETANSRLRVDIRKLDVQLDSHKSKLTKLNHDIDTANRVVTALQEKVSMMEKDGYKLGELDG